jgi:hypothetical protein
MRTLPLAAALVLVGATPAFAHIALTYPKPRPGDLKVGPCAGPTRGTTPTTLEPGSTITVTWDETVPHEGHYRIAFDDAGQDFANPVKIDAADGKTILADGIPDPSGPQKKFQQVVKLPDIECDSCTLQLIQVMSTAPSNWRASEMYFQCADLVLRRGAGTPPTGGGGGADGGTVDEPSDDGATGGCSAGDAPGILLALAAVPLRRRRRSDDRSSVAENGR